MPFNVFNAFYTDFWLEKEPKAGHNCAVTTQNGWKSSRCGQTHRVVCFKIGERALLSEY